jgi:cobalt-zinc-cadmium efflux system protein
LRVGRLAHIRGLLPFPCSVPLLSALRRTGGLIAGSLALLADAAHVVSANFPSGLALFASWLSAEPPTPERRFGHKRAESLVALFSGLTLDVAGAVGRKRRRW